MTMLIGINGFKRSGKDTTYRIVSEMVNARRLAFADKLKLMAGRSLGLAEQGYTDDEILELMDYFKESGTASFHIPLNEAGKREFQVIYGTGVGDRFTGRGYLQWFGAHAREVFGDTFWIDQILPEPFPAEGWVDGRAGPEALNFAYPGDDVLCVTDVRYENEAERIRALGGVIWEVQRPGLESDGHSSEKPLPRHLVDLTLMNSGTVEDLRDEVSAALANLGR